MVQNYPGKIIRSQPPERTYKDFFDKILERMNPNSEFDPVSVHIVLDKYISNSTKSGTRKMRSNDSSIRLFITGLGQFMPQTQNEWKGALSNNDTKRNLFSLFTSYVCSGKANLKLPTIINNEDNTWLCVPGSENATLLFDCNHEEADTRIIYHAGLQGSNKVIISANDSDVFFLGIYACSLDLNRHWFFNYQNDCFADLRKIADLLQESSLHLPTFHCLTGCDTTSYYYFKGKIGPWENALKAKPNSFALISKLGCDRSLSENDLASAVEFVRRYVYGGKEGESLVNTRVQMYQQQKRRLAHCHQILTR